MRESSERAFQTYNRTLKTFNAFKYLGRVLTAACDDWPAVVGKPRKAWKSWVRLTRILGGEGAYLKVLGIFFKAVVQAVLLFGSEMWVLTPRMGRALGSFQHGVARRITGRQPKKQDVGGWEYPLPEAAMGEAGFE